MKEVYLITMINFLFDFIYVIASIVIWGEYTSD